MNPAKEVLSKKLPIFEQNIKELNESYQQLIKYLCEDPKEKSDEVGKRMAKMWSNCEQCLRDIAKEKMMVKKEKEKKEREAAKNKKILENQEKKMKLPTEVKGKGKMAVETMEISKKREEKDAVSILEELKRKREEKSDKFFIFFLLKNLISFILFYLFLFLKFVVVKTKTNGINVLSLMNTFSKKMKNKIKHNKMEGAFEKDIKDICIKAKQEKQLDEINKEIIKSLLS